MPSGLARAPLGDQVAGVPPSEIAGTQPFGLVALALFRVTLRSGPTEKGPDSGFAIPVRAPDELNVRPIT